MQVECQTPRGRGVRNRVVEILQRIESMHKGHSADVPTVDESPCDPGYVQYLEHRLQPLAAARAAESGRRSVGCLA